ncbi:MFN2 (predicted) [Pycnogonum litorale]
MAGYMTRSISMSPVEATSPEFPNGTQDTSVVQMQGSPKFSSDNASRRMYQSSQTSSTSPLKIFVQAKKKVNDIFCAIEKYVNESSTFIQNTKSTNGSVVEGTQIDAVTNYNDRVSSIQEVLSRDHMKVAFFGRTSNGKSTVINGMLRDKILPSGIGHTTNCFLQVEGSETGDAYLLTEDSNERKNVKVRLRSIIVESFIVFALF